MSKLFGWLNKDKPSTEPSKQELASSESSVPDKDNSEQTQVAQAESKAGLLTRLRQRLSKTSSTLGAGVASLFIGKKIDDELFEELETQLLIADVGVDTTTKIIDHLTEQAKFAELNDGEALYQQLKEHMRSLLAPVSQPLSIPEQEGPFVILMVGVNGVGKTTTIGKLAHQFKSAGKEVVLGASDTFRAAAVDQLKIWAKRVDVPIVEQGMNADPASVAYDTLQSAKSK